jgi:predicted RNA-binding protein (virulence factor B family)
MKLGKINRLKVSRISQFGTYLVDDENNEVLLPDDYGDTEDVELDELIDLFIYLNSEDQYAATAQTPLIETNKFAYLQVKDVNRVGAFMDIGISKDLLVPYAEQTEEMRVGNWYLVFMFVDEETDRLVGSCKENEFVFFDEIEVEVGDEVELLLYRKTDLGVHAIVKNLYKGLIFHSDIHKELDLGEKVIGFVKEIREDGKLDILLEPLGYRQSIDPTSEVILTKLVEANGQLFFTDKSSPEDIKQEFGLSKKAFKRGIGNLYKQKKIVILKDSIRLKD